MNVIQFTMIRIMTGVGWSTSAIIGAAIATVRATKLQIPVEVAL